MRRETGKESWVQVPYSEDIASHAVPESCVSDREVRREALTGVRAGQPLSRESLNSVQGADAVSVAEGNTGWGVIASPALALRGLRTSSLTHRKKWDRSGTRRLENVGENE